MIDIKLHPEKFKFFLRMALKQGIDQKIYNDPFFFMKALKLELANALDPELLEILHDMDRNQGPGIVHLIGLPEEPFVPNDETALLRCKQKTRVTESLILATAALLNCYLYSKETEQNGAIIHNVSPVAGKENVISSVGKDPFYYHTEIAYSNEVPKFLMLVCLESDPSAKTSYMYIKDILAGIPENIKQTMRKAIFKINAVVGYDSDSTISPLLSINPTTSEETFRFYQNVSRIEVASDDEFEQREALDCLKFLTEHASRVFPAPGSEPSVGLQKGEGLLFNNGRGYPDKHHGVMHGRVGGIENPSRWLQRGYFFDVTPAIQEKVHAGYFRFLTNTLSKRKNDSFEIAVTCLKTAISNTPDYQRCKNENPEYTQSQLFFHAIKPRRAPEEGRNSWLKRIAEEADIQEYVNNLNQKEGISYV